MRETDWYENTPSVKLKKKFQDIITAVNMGGTEFISLLKLARRQKDVEIFAISMYDINKALEVKSDHSLDDIRENLPPEINNWVKLFRDDHQSSLPPHRSSDIKINVQKDEKGREMPIP